MRTFVSVLGIAGACAMFLACGHSHVPTGPAPAPIAMEATLGNRFVKSGASQTMIARIDLSSKLRASTARPAVNLALLVDTSGSMEGKAIADARAASLALLASLAPEDRLAVITFDSKAERLLPSTVIGDADAKELRAKISAMKAIGTTDMADGLKLAIDEVTAHLDPNGVNRVVLLGDGVPNEDGPVLPLVSEAASRGISVTALGLGDDYDETLMAGIAQRTGGKFHYLEDSTKVASFFAEEIVRLHKVVAKNAVLEINPGPGVTVQRVIGHPASMRPRGLEVPLGDLSYGDRMELVVELASNPTKEGANVEVLDAVLRFQDGVGGAEREERVFIGAKSTKDDTQIGSGRDAKVEDAAARAKDAATTLDKIQNQRNQDRQSQNHYANPVTPSPSPAGAAPPLAPARANDELKKHDQAMHTLGY